MFLMSSDKYISLICKATSVVSCFVRIKTSNVIWFFGNIMKIIFFDITCPFSTYGPSSKTMEIIYGTGDNQFNLNCQYFFFRKNQRWLKYLQGLYCIISRQRYLVSQSHFFTRWTKYLVLLHVKRYVIYHKCEYIHEV